ncbi:DMT family transporter [Microbacterium sp. ZW T5_56]|uniref:DMT family transporter n=1 Tax=Microbacterium sp. ZW T5_56 TaxID=3378081 RepID=UPI003854EEAC
MEDNSRWKWILIAAIAPLAWGSVYFITRNFLPAGTPLWGGVYRALPAGIVLLVIARRLPRGDWWWKSLVLGLLNVGGFFALIYLAGTLLPSSLAATVMSASAGTMLLFGWGLLGQRPGIMAVAGALIGIIGVVVMIGIGTTGVNGWGLLASLAAMLSSNIGFVLTAKWGAKIPPVTLASWQLMAGAMALIPVAALVEGAPPIPQGPQQWLGFLYVSLFATALAYAAWFTGLQRLPASAIGAVGLLNPVSGVILGVAFAGEMFGPAQAIGMVLVVAGVVIGTRRPRIRAVPAPDRLASGRSVEPATRG